MTVPAQFPNFTRQKWIVFINDRAFSTLYDVYLRNFDVRNKHKKEYSVIWFRQMWNMLCELSRNNHTLSMSVENIENTYNPRRPLYGNIQYEAKKVYSRHDGNTYDIIVIDDFNYTIPYTDVYAGKRVTLRENTNKPNKVVLTESQLISIIRETIKGLLRA